MNDLTVLYVEDEQMVRENFTLILKRYFNHVLVAEDGEVAMELYHQHKPNILLLDISIPKISGLEVAQTVRDIDSDVEIVMLTAYSDNNKLLKAANLQIFSYLIKPVKKNELDLVMNKLIEKLSYKSRFKLNQSYSWDIEKQNLFLSKDLIKVTKNEKKLIKLLIKQPGRFYKPCEIADKILDDFDQQDDVHCNNIVQLISRFKKRLIAEHEGIPFFIQNTYGAGYKLML